jgi:predicted RNase H-like HicB family nuclease
MSVQIGVRKRETPTEFIDLTSFISLTPTELDLPTVKPPYKNYFDQRTRNLWDFDVIEIDSLLSDPILSRIEIPEPGKVFSYLLAHSDMINFVELVSKLTVKRFGIGTRFSLEVYEDPEIEDKYLTLYIRQEHYDNRIIHEIKSIQSEYIKELSKLSGWFIITADFRPRRKPHTEEMPKTGSTHDVKKAGAKERIPIEWRIDEDGYYIVSCPLFEACRSYGATFEEALSNLKEVIEMCLEERGSSEHVELADGDLVLNA